MLICSVVNLLKMVGTVIVVCPVSLLDITSRWEECFRIYFLSEWGLENHWIINSKTNVLNSLLVTKFNETDSMSTKMYRYVTDSVFQFYIISLFFPISLNGNETVENNQPWKKPS